MTSNIYIFRNPTNLPWGDYGDILYTGMTMHLERKKGLIQLERTGPFVPPIVGIVGDIVITDEFKTALVNSELTGFSFKPVIKKHIVLLEWEKWDKTADDPLEYPESGEPEDYILERPHSQKLADSLGDVWELCLDVTALVDKVKIEGKYLDVEIYLIESSLPITDFFRAKNVGYVYLSEKAKIWLEENYPEYVSFEVAKIH